MEKIRVKQRRLNHFLDLINADFEKLTDIDKYSLAARFRFSAPMSIFGKRQTAEAHWKAVISILPRVQVLFKKTIEKFIKLKEGKLLPLPPLKRLLEIKDGQFKVLYESTKQMISYGKTPLEDMLEYDIGELGELLNDVQQSAFKKCQNPKCEKMFLQISQKPKLYCSPSCAFKFLSKRRRDQKKKENPSYRDKRSEEAHRSYKKKVEKKLGHPVKIVRRKRKK